MAGEETDHRPKLYDWRFLLRSFLLVAGVLAVILAACGGGSDAPDDETPENLPGVEYPDKGRSHFQGGAIGHNPTPFCEGVPRSAEADAATVATPAPEQPSVIPTDCYNSNPPSSGEHLGVQRSVEIPPGILINIPPDPDVYPPDVEIPRDAIPHILEHAGVFVGYHCAGGDTACDDVVQQIEDVVNQRIDEGDRVVMARDTDLPVGEIAFAAWTRVLNLPYADYTEAAAIDFITTHSCRFDPEGFC